jgi:hypothetical protein
MNEMEQDLALIISSEEISASSKKRLRLWSIENQRLLTQEIPLPIGADLESMLRAGHWVNSIPGFLSPTKSLLPFRETNGYCEVFSL